jgi:uncharacterized protein YhfF
MCKEFYPEEERDPVDNEGENNIVVDSPGQQLAC